MFTLNEIIKAANGQLISRGKRSRFKNISIDSRTAGTGSLFIPLKGKYFDGHKFIDMALNKGAFGTLTSRNIKPIKGVSVVFVKDTEKALQQISKYHKERFDLLSIGVTGSSGKTTTKDMLASILSLADKTLKTEENFNNEIGVPLTLLKLKKEHRFCVIEMAMQGIGEIEELAEIVRPNISIITNIGDAHIGLLRSDKNIAMTKSEILYFQKKADTSVLPFDDKYCGFLTKKAKGKVLTFGLNEKAYVRAANIRSRKGGITFDILYKDKKMAVNLPVPGIFNVYNALAAASAAFALRIKEHHIKNGLEKFRLSSKRMEITQMNGIRIINDSYNANPSSMISSLQMLKDQLPVEGNKPPRRIAVLGGMLELGRFTRQSHIRTGNFVSGLGIDKLFTVGKLGKLIAVGAKQKKMNRVSSFMTNKEALNGIKGQIKRNDVILIKGSRGMKMEEIAEGLKKHA